MHSCPVGQFVLGVQAAQNLLICAPMSGDFSAEIVDQNTQEQGMHACPAGMAMTGVQGSRNLLGCAPLTNAPPSRFVDSTTLEQGMHACASGVPAAGIQISRNILLCAGTQTGETEDSFTQRNGMHSCPPGSFVSGVQAARNLLLCTPAPLDSSREIVDTSTQSHGMHACPEGFAMTGVQAARNQLACTPFNAPLIPRFVDIATQRRGMHACPSGQPSSGIQVARNLLLCGDQHVVRVNRFDVSPTSILIGQSVAVSWNVTCTDPACVVTLSGGGIGGVLPQGQYLGSRSDTPKISNSTSVTYSISAAAGGGIDERSVTVQILAQPSYSFCVTEPNGYCYEVTVTASDPVDAQRQVEAQCPDCIINLGTCGEFCVDGRRNR